jgi:hypothetical protein
LRDNLEVFGEVFLEGKFRSIWGGSLLRDNLEVFYDLSTTDFCPDKEWWPWWEEPFKRETTVIANF